MQPHIVIPGRAARAAHLAEIVAVVLHEIGQIVSRRVAPGSGRGFRIGAETAGRILPYNLVSLVYKLCTAV